jgi:hypothetical protein
MPSGESRAREDRKSPLAPGHRARFEGEQWQEYNCQQNVVHDDGMDHTGAFVIGTFEHHRTEGKEDCGEQREQQMHIEWPAIVLKSLRVFNAAERTKTLLKITSLHQDVADLRETGRMRSY